MLFEITKTAHDRSTAPCKNAVIGPCPKPDTCWFSHNESNSGVKIEYHWFIEIDSIEALIALIEEQNDPLIVDKGDIEIYDDYRE